MPHEQPKGENPQAQERAKAAIGTLHLLDHSSLETIAAETGLALKDVKRDWTSAKTWIREELKEELA